MKNTPPGTDPPLVGSADSAPLRRGWTTGACATAAAKAAFEALVTGRFPDPVSITLPRGGEAAFALAEERLAADRGSAMAAIIKDAGDDPDVTHGALVRATVRLSEAPGVRFIAGEGVGTVTRAGLPLAVGEPAINPVPRRMIETAIAEVARATGALAQAEVTLSIPGGDALAQKTWNPRLGIVGGLSVLGTTGIVTPYSCAAWIHSIHRGVDVARADGLPHIAAATGSTSENTARERLRLPAHAFIDMGDFAGGLLKYLRRHPVPRLTLAGGFAKLSKLAAGALDLHSARSTVDLAALARWGVADGAPSDLAAAIEAAPTAMAALMLADARDVNLGASVARRAAAAAETVVAPAPIAVDVMVVARDGQVVAWHGEGGTG